MINFAHFSSSHHLTVSIGSESCSLLLASRCFMCWIAYCWLCVWNEMFRTWRTKCIENVLCASAIFFYVTEVTESTRMSEWVRARALEEYVWGSISKRCTFLRYASVYMKIKTVHTIILDRPMATTERWTNARPYTQHTHTFTWMHFHGYTLYPSKMKKKDDDDSQQQQQQQLTLLYFSFLFRSVLCAFLRIDVVSLCALCAAALFIFPFFFISFLFSYNFPACQTLSQLISSVYDGAYNLTWSAHALSSSYSMIIYIY